MDLQLTYKTKGGYITMAELKNYIVKDTLEAYIKVGEKDYFYGLTTEGGITRNVSQEDIKAGLGGKVVGRISDEDGFDIEVTTGLFYSDVIELQMGSELSEGNVTIQDVQEDADGLVTVTEKEVTADVMELKSGANPKNAELQLRTLAYDPDTNEVVAEIFYIFDRVQPNGEFSHDFGMGSNNVQTISLSALVPKGSDSYGRYVIVPVTKEGEYSEVSAPVEG